MKTLKFLPFKAIGGFEGKITKYRRTEVMNHKLWLMDLRVETWTILIGLLQIVCKRPYLNGPVSCKPYVKLTLGYRSSYLTSGTTGLIWQSSLHLLTLVRVGPGFLKFSLSWSKLVRDCLNFPGPGPSWSRNSKNFSVLVRAGPGFLKYFRSWSGTNRWFTIPV